MKSGFFNLSDLLKGGLERVGLKGAIKERAALEIWAEVVGPKTASVTKPERIRDGIIYVTCRDSMWSQQLHFLRPLIIEKLNERLGDKLVKEIRLSGIGFKKGQTRQEDEHAAENDKGTLPSLTESEVERIETAASQIADAELAERVKRALRASRALRKRFE
jgi:hypothetical protein